MSHVAGPSLARVMHDVSTQRHISAHDFSHTCTIHPPQVFDLGNHYLQSSSQKLLTGGAAGAGALTLGTTAGPLTTMEIKVRSRS